MREGRMLKAQSLESFSSAAHELTYLDCSPFCLLCQELISGVVHYLRGVFFPIMTSAAADPGNDDRCASCGVAAVDDIQLKKCGGCNLVRYCSVT